MPSDEAYLLTSAQTHRIAAIPASASRSPFMISRRQFFVSRRVGAFGVDRGVWLASRTRLRRALSCRPPQWPAISAQDRRHADLHACDPWMSLEHIQAIVERTNALGADIIVMLGDYVAGHRHVTRFIPADRMGAGARRTEGAARRARHPRQSRLVGRQDGAAGRAGTDQWPAVRSKRPAFRFTRTTPAPDQGRPPVLARRARRSTGLSRRPGGSAPCDASASTISRRRLRK